MTSSAIQKREEHGLITGQTVKWTRDMVDLCKKMVCPKGIKDEEFQLFVEQCKATGFNPFTKEAYCVPRNVNVAPKGQPKRYETVHVFQSSADGMRARAARHPTFHSSSSQPVYELDKCEIDEEAGVVRHQYVPNKPRGKLTGAWGRVTYKSGPPVVVWLPVTARQGTSDFWAADPGGMLAKCAEVAALRKAFPVQFSGVLAREEVQEEREPSRLESALEGHAGAREQGVAPPPAGPVVEFGEWKGRPVSALTSQEATAAIAFANEKLAAQPKAKWAQKMRDNAGLIMGHLECLILAEISKPTSPAGDVVDAELVPPPEEEKLADEPGQE